MDTDPLLEVGRKAWDGSDGDLSRATIASQRLATTLCPGELLPYLGFPYQETAEATLYDSVIRGVDFSTASVSRRRRSPDLKGDVTFRIVGPFFDRNIALRFIDVGRYDAPVADHLCPGNIYWIEFLPPDGNESRHACVIHTLATRAKYFIAFKSVKFGVALRDESGDDDFSLPEASMA